MFFPLIRSLSYSCRRNKVTWSGSRAKLRYENIRKIEGCELHDVLNVPKKRGGSGELLIQHYFELETYRHVMTVYSLTLRNSAGKVLASN